MRKTRTAPVAHPSFSEHILEIQLANEDGRISEMRTLWLRAVAYPHGTSSPGQCLDLSGGNTDVETLPGVDLYRKAEKQRQKTRCLGSVDTSFVLTSEPLEDDKGVLHSSDQMPGVPLGTCMSFVCTIEFPPFGRLEQPWLDRRINETRRGHRRL